VTVSTTIEVLPVTPAAQGLASAMTYGQQLPPVTFVGKSGQPVAGDVVMSPPAGTVLAAGSHDVTVRFTSRSPSYTDVSLSRRVTVAPATPQVVWPVPDPIVFGTPLSELQLNAAVLGVDGRSVAGTVDYYNRPGDLLWAGDNSVSLTFASSDPNYRGTSAHRLMRVLKAQTGVMSRVARLKSQVTATLRDVSNDVPLAGETITFYFGSYSCVATTDGVGVATCDLSVLQLATALRTGAWAVYGGGRNHLESSGFAESAV
jgi:hypothetical protein